ncbi:hypothetical protein V2A60_001873 [Cordyceps javanica]
MENTHIAKPKLESSILLRLPNEIFVAILEHLPVNALLKTTLVCRQIHLLAVHTLHKRLVAISAIPGYELILECYHPTLKLSTPYLSCRYLRTRHPADCDAAAAAAGHATPPPAAQGDDDFPDLLGHVCQLYASFRPVVTEENRRRPFRTIWPGAVAAAAPQGFDSEDEVATQDLHLDGGVRFSQLCAAVNLVTLARQADAFVTHHNISEHVVRVFRRWLDDMAAESSGGGGDPRSWEATAKIPLASNRILWLDTAKTIGLRFHVSLGPAERMPLLSGPDDDPSVSYTLTYQVC